MKKNNSLDYAIEQMKLGSRKGFLNFYRGTVSYVYSSAYLLYNDRDEALRFMEDLYLYMYLNITDYKGDGDVKKWVSKKLLERYRQLMIGKEMSDIGTIQAMQETVELDKDSRNLLETALLTHISFPPQDGGISAIWFMMAVLFIAGVIMLAYLIATNIKPKSTIDAGILNETSKEDQEAEDTVSGDQSSRDDKLKTLSEAQAELDEYLEVYGDPSDNDSVIDITHGPETDGATERIEKSAPDTPETPTVNTPEVPTPSAKTPDVPGTAEDKNSKSGEGNNPNDKIDEFMEKVEEFENYTIAE